MKIELPVRYIPINYQTFHAILKLTIKPVMNTLRIEYSYHNLKQPQLMQTVEQSFLENPSSTTVFKTLPLEMLFKHDISVAQAAQLIFYLEGKLKEQKQFIAIDLPNLKLYLEKSQIYMIYTFIKAVSEQYEVILSNLKVEGVKQNDSTNGNNIQSNNSNNSDRSDINESKEEIKDDSRSNVDRDVRVSGPIGTSGTDRQLLSGQKTDVLEEAFSLSPDKIVNFYLTKQIINNSHNCIVEVNDKVTTINIIPLVDVEMYSYSLSNVSDLNNVINSFEVSQDDVVTNIKQLCQHLNYIISERQNLSAVMLTAALQVTSFLIYLYRIKLPDAKSDNFEGIVNNSIQKIMANVFQIQELIVFKFKDYLELEYEDEIATINTSVAKYNYLLKIDKEEFIDSVLSDVNSSKDKDEEVVQLPLINDPTAIDITKYFGMKIDWKKDKCLLAYEEIPNDQHKVISQAYDQLLKISQSGTTLSIKDIDLTVTKYYDIITSKIFKEIDNNQELVKTNVSTLILVKRFILPFVSNNISNYTLLFLLYQVVIPHLYNMYGMSQFIDVFH